MHCRRCGARLQQGMLICSECGARQRRPTRAIRCARCHGRATIEMTVCPHCGRDLRPAGPRWGLWLGGLAIVILAALWGLGRLPLAKIWQTVTDTRVQLASLVQIPDLSITATPAALAPAYQQDALVGLTPFPTATPTSSPAPLPSATPPAPTPEDAGTPAEATSPAEPAPDAGQSYTVASGDTLAGIGANLGIPWQLLAATNGIDENTPLQVGQKLRLPEPTPTPLPPTETPAAPAPATQPAVTPTATTTPTTPATGPTTYRVQAGDTLEQIGQRLGVAWQAIAAANNITAATVLRVGQELVIPPPGAPLPPTATPRPRPTATPMSPTATPPPSLAAPVLLSPEDQKAFNGEKEVIILKWQPVANLPAGAQYQVTIQWVEKGAPQEYPLPPLPPTTSPNTRAPLWLWGRADQPAPRTYTWFVTVILPASDGQGGQRIIPLSSPSESRTFSWN